MLVPYGYSGASIPLEQLVERQTFTGLHPEFARRAEALIVAGDGRLGIGTGWRSRDIQLSTALQRHQVVASGGCCVWEGKRYQIRPGMAHAAFPGKSFHLQLEDGAGGWVDAMAIDFIGDLDWLQVNCGRFGIRTFADLTGANREPWHGQPIEIPTSVSKWIAAGRPGLERWTLPGDAPTPTPPSPPPVVVPPVITPQRKDHDVLRIIHFGTEGTPDWVCCLVRPNDDGGLRVEWLETTDELAMWRSLGVPEVTWPRPQESGGADWRGHVWFVALVREIGTRGASPFQDARPDAPLDGEWKRAGR